jgi:ubiquinone/menaquinone biosynthesis C-methylase UbiE
MPTLSHDEAKAFYDGFGARQDSQKFYEDPALDDLVAHADFGAARCVFEFGCGTGRFAARLLAEHLPPGCRYQAVDISATMVELAKQRLTSWGDRARVAQSSGAPRVPAPDASVDRFVVCYVLDVLSEPDIRQLLAEAHRVLEPGGLLCTLCLTRGTSLSTRVVDALWRALFRLQPKLVGGCRSIAVRDFLGARDWSLRHRNVITRFGISSEVLVAARSGDSR